MAHGDRRCPEDSAPAGSTTYEDFPGRVRRQTKTKTQRHKLKARLNMLAAAQFIHRERVLGYVCGDGQGKLLWGREVVREDLAEDPIVVRASRPKVEGV